MAAAAAAAADRAFSRRCCAIAAASFAWPVTWLNYHAQSTLIKATHMFGQSRKERPEEQIFFDDKSWWTKQKTNLATEMTKATARKSIEDEASLGLTMARTDFPANAALEAS